MATLVGVLAVASISRAAILLVLIVRVITTFIGSAAAFFAWRALAVLCRFSMHWGGGTAVVVVFVTALFFAGFAGFVGLLVVAKFFCALVATMTVGFFVRARSLLRFI